MGILASIILKTIAKHALKSATAAVAAGIGATGVATYLNPALLDLIPTNWRGPVITLVSVAVLLARFRGEIKDAITASKAVQ